MRPVLFILSFLTGACRLPNLDHCVHKAADSDAWCAANDPARPFCSPCADEAHGCVAAAPDPEVCPAYAPDTTGETATSDTSSDTATSSETATSDTSSGTVTSTDTVTSSETDTSDASSATS